MIHKTEIYGIRIFKKQDGKTFASFTGHGVRLHNHDGPEGQSVFLV
jgi:hypothetical protein